MRRGTAVLLTGILLLALPAAAAGTRHALTLSNATTDTEDWLNAFDPPATGVGDFDGDGHAELVAHNDNQKAYVLSTRDSRVLAELAPPYPAGWGARPLTAPVVEDVDADGRLDVVLTTSAATTCVYEHRPGASAADAFAFHREWCHRADRFDGPDHAAVDGTPHVEDVTGDGKAEIFLQTEERGLFAYDHDGAVRWAIDAWGGNAGPNVADLDRDGRKEVLFFGDGGEVRAVDAQDGWVKWEFFAKGLVWPASIPVAGATGDLDGDGLGEVAFAARNATHSENGTFDENHMAIVVLDHAGQLQWWRMPQWANPMSYTHPVIHDLDGDGANELLMQDWNTIGHKPGDWQVTGEANVFAYDAGGALLWRTVLDNTWSNDDVPLADADGDGDLEVFAIGYGPGGDGVWYLDAATGERQRHVASGGWPALRAPVLGDLDGSGTLEWALPVHDSDRGGALRVYDTDAPCRVAYGGWQNEDPCGLTGAAGAGAFEAEFAGVAGDEWWVQVQVRADEPVARVDVRVDGGPWQPLTDRGWGWGASVHAPPGSAVQFRAVSAAGGAALSDAYAWPPA